jgi:hypothetical protein
MWRGIDRRYYQLRGTWKSRKSIRLYLQRDEGGGSNVWLEAPGLKRKRTVV